MADDTNYTIKLPKQFYVGLKAQHQDDLPLGFATPYEPGLKAYEKRKETVDVWAIPHGKWNPETRKNEPVPKMEPLIIDNDPKPGFKVAESVRRVYWGGGNVVWRIEDPRGFELEISSSNLARIIDCATIKNGIITVDCVWGRDKANNVLLPVTSEPYKQAVQNTDRAANKVALKDVTIGDKVLLKNGEEGVYAGAFNVLAFEIKEERGDRYNSRSNLTKVNLFNVKRRFAIRRELTEKDLEQWTYQDKGFAVGDPEFTFVSELSVSKIIEKTEQPKSFLNEVQEFIEKSKSMWRTGVEHAFYITDKPIKKDFIKPVFVPVELEEVMILVHSVMNRDGTSGPMFFYENDKKIQLNRAYSTYGSSSYNESMKCSVRVTPVSFVDQFTIEYCPDRGYYNNFRAEVDATIIIPQWHAAGKISMLAFEIEGNQFIPEGHF